MALAAFAACALWLPTARAEGKKTFFTATEWDTVVGVDTGFTDGTTLFILGLKTTTLNTGSDERIAGTGRAVTLGAVWDSATLTGPQWGRIHIENSGGQWDGYWQGTRSLEDTHIITTVTGTTLGSGGYKGLVAYWSWRAADVDMGNPLQGTGYIVEAKPGHDERPLRVSGLRTDQLQMVPGVFLNPLTSEVIGPGLLGRVDILRGVGRSSHLGRYTEQGLGIFDPRTGAVTAMGSDISVGGEKVLWLAEGATQICPDEKTAVFNGGVHFSGGTGRFGAATGGFMGTIEEQLQPTADPLVSLAEYG